MVLSAEVMREYDKRFVYKKVFGTRVDRGVGTSEGESSAVLMRKVTEEGLAEMVW
jgi:hypothetical protein